jgi:hypothetical protein
MTAQNVTLKIGASPGKLALVAGLAVVLVAVLRGQMVDEPTHGTRLKRPAPRRSQAVAGAASQPAEIEKSTLVETSAAEWPELQFAEVIRHDPLAMPAWFLATQKAVQAEQQPGATRSLEVLEELKKLSTNIVVITAEDRVANIGDEFYRVGDRIENLEVSEITPTGIRLTEID